MLKVGFSRLDVTPPLGSDISGYFFRRLAKGVLDPLYLNAVAIECDGERVVLMAIDYIGITLECINKAKRCIAPLPKSTPRHVFFLTFLTESTRSTCAPPSTGFFPNTRKTTALR